MEELNKPKQDLISNQELAPEDKAIVFNEEEALSAIEKTMTESPGYSLIRYEARGTRELDTEQRKMTKEDLRTYFNAAKRDGVLMDIFDEGLAQVKKRNEPVTLENIIKYGLTWWEYYNYRARMAVVKKADRKALRKEITKVKKPLKAQPLKTQPAQETSGIPLRENPEPYHPGQAVGERPMEAPAEGSNSQN